MIPSTLDVKNTEAVQLLEITGDPTDNLPTGDFRIIAFWNNRDEKEHVAIVHGDLLHAKEVPTRLHSECLTGDALGSLRCDCRDQLQVALRKIAEFDHGRHQIFEIVGEPAVPESHAHTVTRARRHGAISLQRG